MTTQRRAAVETADLSPAAPPAPLATPVANGAGQTSPLLPVLTGPRRPAAAGISSPAGGEPSANADGTSSPLAGSTLSAGQLAIAKAMSEDRGPDSLDAHVRRLMKDLGLRGFHAHDARRSEAGYPDWTIAGLGGQIWRELKTQRGKVRPEQQEWLDVLSAGGGDAAVWRPEHLLDGTIARELAAISGLRVKAGAAC